MDTRLLDRHSLEARWEANERELLRLAVMPLPEREFHANREDELLDEQDAIELQLGFDASRQPQLTSFVRYELLEVGP
jgi:hypothetical protein